MTRTETESASPEVHNEAKVQEEVPAPKSTLPTRSSTWACFQRGARTMPLTWSCSPTRLSRKMACVLTILPQKPSGPPPSSSSRRTCSRGWALCQWEFRVHVLLDQGHVPTLNYPRWRLTPTNIHSQFPQS